ncbi:MAG: tRNA epoxyqueuosine(34) reductase QueG [Balneolaceae bacterium]|nr:tRNA epoxyqueuosine(34) reductase QueG [Balneolaceae bacterium]
MLKKQKLTEQIRTKALQMGFDACGFAKARRLEDEERRLEEWLNQGKHATMGWMENHFDKRVDPTLLVPGSKTVVSVLSSYHHPTHTSMIGNKDDLQIAKYAQGRDYHKVVKKKLKKLFQYTEELVGGLHGRFFTDSAPVLDKAWAVRSGLGWIGKNSNLLNKNMGSFFFIGEMIIDIELSYDAPVTDHCGSCTRCLDACPTDAIYEPYRVDASRCISYLTIEHKGEIDKKYHTNMENWIFGCDICQDVCPWNSKSVIATFEDLHPRDRVVSNTTEDWVNLTEEEFNSIFEGSPVRRTKHQGLSRNIKIASQNLNKN